MKSTLFLTIILLSFRLAEGQTVGAIQFVYRAVYHEGYANLPHGTLTICVGKFVQPNGYGFIDPDDRSAILTDPKTYNWVKEYILCSKFTYTIKNAEEAMKVGKSRCPGEASLEVIGSGGIDVFVCRNDWRA